MRLRNNIPADLLPKTLTIIDDSSFEENDRGVHVQLHPKVYTYKYPTNADDLEVIISDVTPKLREALSQNRDIRQEIKQCLNAFEQDLLSASLVSLTRGFTKQPNTQFAISFQTRIMGGAESPSYFFMPECDRYTIRYPAGDDGIIARDRKNGYTAYAHELAHFYDDDRKKGPLHSSSTLFRACFDLDRKIFPNGLAAEAIKLSEISGYYEDEQTQEVLYGEYFANSLAFAITTPSKTSEDSPLVKYFELVEQQAKKYSNEPNQKSIDRILQQLHRKLTSLAGKARAIVASSDTSSASTQIMQLIDEAKKEPTSFLDRFLR